MPMTIDKKKLRPSATFPQAVIDEIHRAADEGIYEIRGFGAKRGLPTFLRHESAHVTDASCDDDVDTFHRDAATA